MSLKFEWDRKKATTNISKHQVSFEEALTVFADPLARIFDDDQSTEEHREIIIGHAVNERLLVVFFVAEGTLIRIFSARNASTRERKDYEENLNS